MEIKRTTFTAFIASGALWVVLYLQKDNINAINSGLKF